MAEDMQSPYDHATRNDIFTVSLVCFVAGVNVL